MDFSKHFAHKEGLIYLNSGSLSRTPNVVVDSFFDEVRLAEENPTTYLFGAWERMWTAQQSLARLLRAQPEDIYLRPNVTQAMNDFLLTVQLPLEGEILISDLEYGAIVNICRRRAELSGLKLRTFKLPFEPEVLRTLTSEQLLQVITSQLRPDTRMLMLSHIITANGMILPIDEIGKACRKNNTIFAVDGAHGPGALPIDFSQLGNVDFYGGNVHKWLMGPKGTGFGWVHPHLQDNLFPTQVGWTTYDSPGGFGLFAPGSRFAGRFLTSNSIDFAPYFALPKLEEFWIEHNSEIRAKLKKLHLAIRPLAEKLGWPILSPQSEQLAGPLYSVDIPDRLQAEGYGLMMRLEREFGLMVSTPPFKGRHLLRLSPHIYNSVEDLEKAFKVIAAI